MKHFRLYLWKEWRDQRAGLLCLALALPVLLAIATIAWDGRMVDEAVRPGVAATIAGLVALLVVGTDLLPGEVRRGRVRFLERLPGGLGTAFAAKLALFVGAAAAAAVSGAVLASAFFALRHGAMPSVSLDALDERFVLPAIAVALWTFAASAWVPHGALAFPAAAIAIAVVCAPAWLFYGPNSTLVPTSIELRAFCGLSAIGAAVSAWCSFVHGHRRGGSTWRAARYGMLVALASMIPAWVWAGVRLHSAAAIDPHDAAFRIEGGYLGADGEHVFLCTDVEVRGPRSADRRSESRRRPLVVDLRTGAWRSLTEGPAWLVPVRLELEHNGVRSPRLLCAETTSIVQDGELVGDERFAFDAQGNVVDASALERTIFAGLEEQIGPRTELDVLVPRLEGVDAAPWNRSYRDPFRCRSYPARDLFGDDEGSVRVSMHRGRWLVQRSLSPFYELFDPETRASTPLPDLPTDLRTLWPLDDERYLVFDGNRLDVMELESGKRESITHDDLGPIDHVASVSSFPVPLARFDPIVLALHGPGWHGFGRLDLAQRRLTTARSGATLHFVACEDRDTVLAIEDHRRLVRLRFGTGERVVLFPR